MEKKVGDIFYKSCLLIESHRSEKSILEMEVWIITKIVPTGYYLKEKVDKVTWGKKSTKNGDFGFLPNVPEYYKTIIGKDESFEAKGFWKTKKWAAKSSIYDVKKKISELSRILKRLEKY